MLLLHQEADADVYKQNGQGSSRAVDAALRQLGDIDLTDLRFSYKWDEAVRVGICHNRAAMMLPAMHARADACTCLPVNLCTCTLTHGMES
jgi:hypothetical protein